MRTETQRWLVRWAGPTLLVSCATLFLLCEIIPRLDDGSSDLRRVQHAMHDEHLILERVWAMVERRDLHHSVGVYPGLYPYTAGIVRAALGKHATDSTAIVLTRAVSMVAIVLAVILSFLLYARLAKNPWVGAVFASLLAIHPETALWGSRVHPDALLILFDQVALGLFGLHVDSGKKKYLFGATLCAGLSAGTKLIGAFIMVTIGAWILWSELVTERRDPKPRDLRRLAGSLALNGLLFIAVLVATNPLLLTHTAEILEGWLIQHQANLDNGTGGPAWLSVFLGPRGLGVVGSGVALAGLVRIGVTRRLDGRAMIVAFALFYVAYLVLAVTLAFPRFAFPAVWPLLFAGLVALDPSAWRRPRLAWAAICAASIAFFTFEWPRMRAEHAYEATFFARNFTPDKEEVGRRLLDLAKGHRMAPDPHLAAITSFYTYVPPGIPWHPIWTVDELKTIPDDAFALVIDSSLRSAGGEQYRRLARSELGFSATATVGEFVIYSRVE